MFPLAAASAAALIAGAALAPMATASSPAGGSARHTPAAAISLGHHTDGAASITKLKGKCHTIFGTFANDGIISWNSPASGVDAAGAADFTCTKAPSARRTFSTIGLVGFFGDAGTSQFLVTVYGSANGEPDTSSVVCATQTATGAPTGGAPDATLITRDTPCKGKMGSNWLEIQIASDANSWYWGTQAEVGGKYPADWCNSTGAFGTPCGADYQNGLSMQDCIFGGDVGENDFIFTLN